VAGLFVLVFSVAGCAQERRYTQPSSAMEPTIRAEEDLAADPGAYKHSVPQRSDVVVSRHEGILEVKRVIAIASDTIQGKDFNILLNGNLLTGSYIQHLANAGTISYSVPTSKTSAL
jgi:signal peptidase I